jgi:HEAT repeat protein
MFSFTETFARRATTFLTLFGLLVLLINPAVLRAQEQSTEDPQIKNQIRLLVAGAAGDGEEGTLSEKERKQTAEELGKTPSAVDPLIKELRAADNDDVRSSLALALGEALKVSRDDETLGKIARALGETGPSAAPAVDGLIAALGSARNTQTCADIAEALAKIGPESVPAVDSIIDVLKESTTAGPAPTAKDEEDKKQLQLRLAKALATIGQAGGPPLAVHSLVMALGAQDQEEPTRRWLAYALGEIGPTADSSVHPLIEALKEIKNDETRIVIAKALARMGPSAEVALTELERAKWEAEKSSSKKELSAA